MTTLPLWLTLYIAVGLGLQLLAMRRVGARVAPTTWLGCIVAVVAVALMWPLFVVTAVAKAVRQ